MYCMQMIVLAMYIERQMCNIYPSCIAKFMAVSDSDVVSQLGPTMSLRSAS